MKTYDIHICADSTFIEPICGVNCRRRVVVFQAGDQCMDDWNDSKTNDGVHRTATEFCERLNLRDDWYSRIINTLGGDLPLDIVSNTADEFFTAIMTERKETQ